MTNEQLNQYEALSTLVDQQHDHVTDAAAALVGMSIKDGESVAQYAARVQDAIDNVNVQRMYLENAKAGKRAYVRSL